MKQRKREVGRVGADEETSANDVVPISSFEPDFNGGKKTLI